MSYIIASLPPVKCFVRREYLYNFEKGHGELEPAIWVSIKALRGQVFRVESLLPAYGALYDKLPISAYVWKTEHSDLPIDTLQLWDCMSYRFTVHEKIGLRNLGVKFLGKENGQFAIQPNNRCLWYDQSLIPAETKFPDFQAARTIWTVDGTRKWSAGDDWFYDIKDRNS